MSEKRFLELVNLYLDNEISKEELAELEREMETDSFRQEVFNRYCHLQAASEEVSRHYGNHLTSTVDFKSYHMLARHSQRRIRKGFLYSASAMAAACLAVAAALHVMESSMDYTDLPPISDTERFADVSVEVFDARQMRNETARVASRGSQARQVQAAFPVSVGWARSESVRFRESSARDSNPSPQLFQASMRFDAVESPPREAPPVFNKGGFDASFTDFASFQFQR